MDGVGLWWRMVEGVGGEGEWVPGRSCGGWNEAMGVGGSWWWGELEVERASGGAGGWQMVWLVEEEG